MWDDDAGYDTSDPKHPSWGERMADQADIARKRQKEQPPERPSGDRESELERYYREGPGDDDTGLWNQIIEADDKLP